MLGERDLVLRLLSPADRFTLWQPAALNPFRRGFNPPAGVVRHCDIASSAVRFIPSEDTNGVVEAGPTGANSFVGELDSITIARHGYRSPRFSPRASAAARSAAVDRVYRSIMSRVDQPATDISPPSEPPAASHRDAAVCLSKCG